MKASEEFDLNYIQFILFPARQEQIQSAIEQDKLYEDHVRKAVDLMPGTTSRSLSNISVQANPIVVSASNNCCIATTGPPPQSDQTCFSTTDLTKLTVLLFEN